MLLTHHLLEGASQHLLDSCLHTLAVTELEGLDELIAGRGFLALALLVLLVLVLGLVLHLLDVLLELRRDLAGLLLALILLTLVLDLLVFAGILRLLLTLILLTLVGLLLLVILSGEAICGLDEGSVRQVHEGESLILNRRLRRLLQHRAGDLGSQVSLPEESFLVRHRSGLLRMAEGVPSHLRHPDLVAGRLATTLFRLPRSRRGMGVLAELRRAPDVVGVSSGLLLQVVLIHRSRVFRRTTECGLSDLCPTPGGALTHDRSPIPLPPEGI